MRCGNGETYCRACGDVHATTPGACPITSSRRLGGTTTADRASEPVEGERCRDPRHMVFGPSPHSEPAKRQLAELAQRRAAELVNAVRAASEPTGEGAQGDGVLWRGYPAHLVGEVEVGARGRVTLYRPGGGMPVVNDLTVALWTCRHLATLLNASLAREAERNQALELEAMHWREQANEAEARAGQLAEALVSVKYREAPDGPCWCPNDPEGCADVHGPICEAARAALAKEHA